MFFVLYFPKKEKMLFICNAYEFAIFAFTLTIYKCFSCLQKVAKSIETTPNETLVTNPPLMRTSQKIKIFLYINYKYGDEQEILDN